MRKSRSICAECPALEKGLCGALEEDELARLGQVTWHRRFQAGKIIHAEGEVPPSFCAVISGVVKLMKSLPNGNQQIVGLAGPGDFLGRPFSGEARASAVAASEVQLCWFPRATIETLATDSSEVKSWLFEHVADELEKAQEWIMLLGRMTAEQKIAAFLVSVVRNKNLEGVEEQHPSGDLFLELPLSRTEMADYLGLTIETVSRHIAKLRERGIVSVAAGRSLVLHDVDALNAVIDSAMPSARAREPLRA
jgi:CRP/FNR family transcriptional regulator, anaerobic regulatory protein